MKKVFLLGFLGWFLLGPVAAQNKPAWVDRPSAVYPEALYVSAVGSGRDRNAAENNAKGALVSYFKQSVSSRITITEAERRVNGRTSSASGVSLSVEAASALDTLIGAEIKAAWNDAKNNWWAVAVLEKARGRERYAGELAKVMDEITRLSDISGGVSFDTLVKCRSARERFGGAEVYALILSMLDGPDRQPELIHLAAQVDNAYNQAQALPVDVRVAGDTGGRLKAALAGAFTALGFRTGNRNSRFVLEAALQLEAVPKNRYFNTRYTVDAVLKDTKTGAELLTYNISDRESHPAGQEEADIRARTVAVEAVEASFPGALKEYLGL